MARDKPRDWNDIEIQFEGKTVKGHYYVERGMVTVMTAYGQESTQVGGSSPMTTARIIDHLVGAGEQHGRHVEPECSRGLQVDDELELGGLHDRQVGGLRALEDLTGLDRITDS
jgi:hypothetical protein